MGSTATDIGNNENENDMVCGDTILVHADPGSDHQHGSPGCSQDIGENSPNQQEDKVVEWSGFAFDSDMDPSRDHVREPTRAIKLTYSMAVWETV